MYDQYFLLSGLFVEIIWVKGLFYATVLSCMKSFSYIKNSKWNKLLFLKILLT